MLIKKKTFHSVNYSGTPHFKWGPEDAAKGQGDAGETKEQNPLCHHEGKVHVPLRALK